jgi:hypothetical protein
MLCSLFLLQVTNKLLPFVQDNIKLPDFSEYCHTAHALLPLSVAGDQQAASVCARQHQAA